MRECLPFLYLPLPSTHADLPTALREVHRALEFYERQTADQEELAEEDWLRWVEKNEQIRQIQAQSNLHNSLE